MHFPRPMDETRLAEEFLLQMQGGEFDGRLYETITKLSTDELQQIVTLAADRHWPTTSSDAPRMREPRRDTPGALAGASSRPVSRRDR